MLPCSSEMVPNWKKSIINYIFWNNKLCYCLYVSLSLYLSVCVTVCMSVSPSEWPSVYLKACMCLSETAVCLSYQYYYLYVCEYDYLCMSVCLLFYLSIYLALSVWRIVMTMNGISVNRKKIMTMMSIIVVFFASRNFRFSRKCRRLN